MSDAGFWISEVHPGVSLYCATSAMLRSRCLLAAVGKHAVAPWPRVAMSAEVADALHHGRPVVALESTIISHGMVSNRCAMPTLQPHADVGRVYVHVQPFPQNLETAKELEGIIRAGGATPATIAIVDGVVTVGMEGSQLEAFASLKPSSVLKASRRDIGLAIAKNATAATTIAGTMCVVPRAGRLGRRLGRAPGSMRASAVGVILSLVSRAPAQVSSTARGYQRVCCWWSRRGAPWRRDNVRHLGRSDRAGTNSRRGSVGWCQVDPGHRQDSGGVGDAGNGC